MVKKTIRVCRGGRRRNRGSGTEMIEVLEERKFPVARLVPLASTRSAGEVTFAGK